MGRLEALIVAALGRSPYDEQVIGSQRSTDDDGGAEPVQQYDDRGHPINLETRRRMRDHVRASNEVMQAAGIIEETSEIRARDKSQYDSLQEETQIGLRRLEVGRVLLVAGVWGVLGLKRRILLYREYSKYDLLEIVRGEHAHYSVPHLLCFGLPALAVYQGSEWVSLILQAMAEPLDVDYTKSIHRSREDKTMNEVKRILSRMLNLTFRYTMLHYQTFSLLQQLNLIPPERTFPSLQSLIPFSAHSPLQLPPLPASTTFRSVVSWVMALAAAAAPMGLVFTYSVVGTAVSSMVYRPIYRMLPRPMNINQDGQTLRVTDGIGDIYEVVESQHSVTETQQPTEPDTNIRQENWNPLEMENAEHTATLEALEGRTRTGRDDSSSDGEDHEMGQQTLITFDVEATEVSEASMGTWSAELRSANEVLIRPSSIPAYQITPLTMLPPLLATEGLSSVFSSIILLPLEALMVRTLGRAYRTSAGLDIKDLSGFDLQDFSFQKMLSLIGVHCAELLIMGTVWAGYTFVSQTFGGKVRFSSASNELASVSREGDEI